MGIGTMNPDLAQAVPECETFEWRKGEADRAAQSEWVVNV
jgi:hypothetical protein